MIWDEPQPGAGGSAKRAVVECDKEDCPESYYIPDVSAYDGAKRMRNIGWDVTLELVHGITIDGLMYGSKQGFHSRCPEHAGDA